MHMWQHSPEEQNRNSGRDCEPTRWDKLDRPESKYYQVKLVSTLICRASIKLLRERPQPPKSRFVVSSHALFFLRSNHPTESRKPQTGLCVFYADSTCRSGQIGPNLDWFGLGILGFRPITVDTYFTVR